MKNTIILFILLLMIQNTAHAVGCHPDMVKSYKTLIERDGADAVPDNNCKRMAMGEKAVKKSPYCTKDQSVSINRQMCNIEKGAQQERERVRKSNDPSETQKRIDDRQQKMEEFKRKQDAKFNRSSSSRD